MSGHRHFETQAAVIDGGKGTISVQLVEAKSHQDEEYRAKGYAPLHGGGVTVYFDLSILEAGGKTVALPVKKQGEKPATEKDAAG